MRFRSAAWPSGLTSTHRRPVDAAYALGVSDPVGSVYERIGENGIIDVVRRFYAKVREDEVIGPLYPPNDWENAERRLRMFLIQRFGGPATYSERRGHPRLRMRHVPFAIGQREAERWLELMRDSLRETDLVPPDVAQEMWPYLVNTAMFLVNRSEPAREG